PMPAWLEVFPQHPLPLLTLEILRPPLHPVQGVEVDAGYHLIHRKIDRLDPPEGGRGHIRRLQGSVLTRRGAHRPRPCLRFLVLPLPLAHLFIVRPDELLPCTRL